MSSNEHELIEQIKLAEQQAEQLVRDAKNKSSKILVKAQSERIRRLESAKREAREILKKKIDEARDSRKHEKVLASAEKESIELKEKTHPKIAETAKKIAEFILEISKES